MKRGWIIGLVVVVFNLSLIMQCPVEAATDISGQWRLRPEFRDNADFDDTTTDTSSFYGQRIRVGLSTDVNPDLSAYVQIQDTRNWGTEGHASSLTDVGEAVDIHQGYVTVKNIGGLSLALKAGRQELAYGSQRLVGAFGWSNQSRAFDAIKLMYSGDVADIDFWTAKVTETNVVGGKADEDVDFYGLYSTFSNLIPDNNLQAYALLKKNGSTELTEYTVGARLAGNVSGVGVDYTGEVAYQLGEMGTSDISAYALAVEAGYTIPNVAWSPKVAVEFDMATGDDGTDADINTFDNLYPTNHLHYGYMDYQSWKNMNDIALKLSAKPSDKCFVYLAYHILSLAEKEDHWYAASGAVKMAGDNGEDAVGNELDIVAKHKFNKNLNIEGGISQFFAGDFIEKSVGASKVEDSTWAYLMGTVNF